MDNTLTLTSPVQRGETSITDITIIKPNAGTLRGVRLADLANSDVDALLTVLPRITSPQLTRHECTLLELPDMVALAGKIIGFLSPTSDETASPQA
ncbi:phage tail assembly protein [Sodalis ligni]|uniref:Tail assembly chaperone E/41/14-like protein n=1 Tax=Sodalis ligni TaxID=2697027 RepID=A0A4R1N8Q1_9GAMM|nr:phage tail assembly protein [Sodalis ligni]TCL03724.1 tail assembly chaperone E/41/14-like protein [Sodalis ligni]